MSKLRPYQDDLVEGVRKSWRDGHKAPCIVLPCGGGKSCILAEMGKRTTWSGKRVLFLVHRKELVDQIVGTFVRWGVDMRYCDIMMVQTATRRRAKLPKPDLIMTDENHHSLATSYKNIYEQFPDVLRVGVTATPVRLNGDGLGDVNDDLVIGVSAKWLIENKCLAPYDYYAPSIADLTGLHTKMGEYVTADIEKAMIKKAIFGDTIAYYRKLADGKKAICYCASIRHSKAMADAFSEAGIPAAHIDGETPKPERAALIAKFRSGEIRILCNVDLISEGFDVPDCECAILLRPTQSLTLYIQQSMRCMRYREGKRAVIIDHVGNYARFGLPDEDREWTLDKKQKKKRTASEEVKAQMCPECFMTFNPEVVPKTDGRTTCPNCGYVFPKKEREELEEKASVLEKIEGFTLKYDNPNKCKSYDELLDYAKQHGYKPGWAYYQAKRRGLLFDTGA